MHLLLNFEFPATCKLTWIVFIHKWYNLHIHSWSTPPSLFPWKWTDAHCKLEKLNILRFHLLPLWIFYCLLAWLACNSTHVFQFFSKLLLLVQLLVPHINWVGNLSPILVLKSFQFENRFQKSDPISIWFLLTRTYGSNPSNLVPHPVPQHL